MKLEMSVFLLVFVYLENAFRTFQHEYDMITLVAVWRTDRRKASEDEGKPGRKLM